MCVWARILTQTKSFYFSSPVHFGLILRDNYYRLLCLFPPLFLRKRKGVPITSNCSQKKVSAFVVYFILCVKFCMSRPNTIIIRNHPPHLIVCSLIILLYSIPFFYSSPLEVKTKKNNKNRQKLLSSSMLKKSNGAGGRWPYWSRALM